MENEKIIKVYSKGSIRYNTSGTEPTKNSPIYKSPLKTKKQHIRLKTFANNNRSSRTTLVKDESYVEQLN